MFSCCLPVRGGKIEHNFTPLLRDLFKHKGKLTFKIFLVVLWASHSNNSTKITIVSREARCFPEMSVTVIILL
jgi:hypothetical protein